MYPDTDLVILGVHHENLIADRFFETVAHFEIQHCGAPVLLVRDRTRGPYRLALVNTDFSECARRALHAAIALAPRAEFYVLHVYETPFPQFIRFNEQELKELREERSSQIEKDVQEELRRFTDRSVGGAAPRIVPMLERNDVAAGIAKVVRQSQPDLLVMGMSGAGFATPGGSRTRAYLDNPPCDMLVTA
jgi:nucleotide-binding universal stress UspA family protein